MSRLDLWSVKSVECGACQRVIISSLFETESIISNHFYRMDMRKNEYLSIRCAIFTP